VVEGGKTPVSPPFPPDRSISRSHLSAIPHNPVRWIAEYINVDPILCSQAEAGRMLAIGKTKLGELIAQGELESVRIGSRRLVRIESIQNLAGVTPEKQEGS